MTAIRCKRIVCVLNQLPKITAAVVVPYTFFVADIAGLAVRFDAVDFDRPSSDFAKQVAVRNIRIVLGVSRPLFSVRSGAQSESTPMRDTDLPSFAMIRASCRTLMRTSPR
jgi:hypothetical protein